MRDQAFARQLLERRERDADLGDRAVLSAQSHQLRLYVVRRLAVPLVEPGQPTIEPLGGDGNCASHVLRIGTLAGVVRPAPRCPDPANR
jgi:hypothetical protein